MEYINCSHYSHAHQKLFASRLHVTSIMDFTAAVFFLFAIVGMTSGAVQVEGAFIQKIINQMKDEINKQATVDSAQSLQATSQGGGGINLNELYMDFQQNIELACHVCLLLQIPEAHYPNSAFYRSIRSAHQALCNICKIGKSILIGQDLFSKYLGPYFGGDKDGNGNGNVGSPVTSKLAGIQLYMNLLKSLKD